MLLTRSSLHSYLLSVNPPSHELVAGVALVGRLTALLDQFNEQVLASSQLFKSFLNISQCLQNIKYQSSWGTWLVSFCLFTTVPFNANILSALLTQQPSCRRCRHLPCWQASTIFPLFSPRSTLRLLLLWPSSLRPGCQILLTFFSVLVKHKILLPNLKDFSFSNISHGKFSKDFLCWNIWL